MNVGLWCRLRAGGNQSGLIGSDCGFSAPHICMDCGLKTALVCEPERACLRAVTVRGTHAYDLFGLMCGKTMRRPRHTYLTNHMKAFSSQLVTINLRLIAEVLGLGQVVRRFASGSDESTAGNGAGGVIAV